MPSLTPLPGRALLKFQPPAETSRNGIIIPQTSQQRVEIGEVLAVGDPTNDRERIIAANLKAGDRIPVSYGAGISYFKKDYSEEDVWLRDLRLYPISELAAKVIE